MTNVYNIENWISLRYSSEARRFRACGISKTFGIFDWVIWDHPDSDLSRTNTDRPQTILCHAGLNSVNLLVSKTNNLSSRPSVVFAGADTRFSSLKSRLEPIADRFQKIFFEAKDVPSDVVQSFCMGFISFYLRANRPKNIAKAIEYSDKFPKSLSVLASWGRRWKYLDKTVADRSRAIAFLQQCDYLSRRSIPFERYWQELAKYRFLMAPRGAGIQSPKLAEAWMLKVVPIVTRTPCFTDLRDMGFPVIILDDWHELTPDAIKKWEAQYIDVDWAKVRYMLTNDYLKELLS